jgi:transcriptional regulator with XRE-family HTH domain
VTAQPAPPHPAGRFAGVIRRARLVAGLSQSEVASGVGVAPSTVSQWERGQTIPTVPLYGGLVALLGPWPLLEALLPPGQARIGREVRAKLSDPSRKGPSGGVGGSIRTARQAAGLTQTQLGVRVGVRQSSVGQWEGGRTLPTLPMLRRLVAVLGPWPLLETLLWLPSERAGRTGTLVAAPSRDERPSREELARLVAREGRSDQQLAAHYRQPIGTILRWRRAYRLERAAPLPQAAGRLARPSREELERLAIQQAQSDQELAARYGRSTATIRAWRLRYGLARPQPRVDRARLLALCRQGLPAGEIAQQVGCTLRTVSKLARAAGVQVASGGRPPARRPRPTGRVETDGDLTDQELTAAEVAGLFQVSESAVHTWADQDRLPFRRIKGQRRFPAPAVARLAHQHQVPLPDWLHPATPTHQEPV